jgi:hypothetical protein
MTIVARDWRPLERNTLRGFVKLMLEPSGLVLNDCAVHRRDDREWIGLPGKPQVDRDGQLRKDPATGKICYTPAIEIPDKNARERFQRAAVAAVHALLGEEAAP